jgi:hypothetical protein
VTRAPSPGRLLALLAALAAAGEVRAAPPPAAPASPGYWPPEARVVESKALEILKASSARLAAARTLTFTAVLGDESPSRHGPPLFYATRTEVALQRPDRLRVITTGDGPRSELYLDGRSLVAWAPAENLVARAPAPPTLDGALEAAHRLAQVYYPFADLIVADPMADLAPDLRLAFYVGQSRSIGGTTTDIVAYATDDVFVQIWVGTADRLPRWLRAVYLRDPQRLRHEMALSDWALDPKLPPGTFDPPAAALRANPMPFAAPGSPAAGAAPAATPRPAPSTGAGR